MSRVVSRRSLLFGRFLKELEDEPVKAPSRPPVLLPLLRPPGAIEEGAFLAACTRCDACIKACPPNALHRASPRLKDAAGTPFIDPTRSPCLMCDERHCVAACETGALLPELPSAMGTARIDPTTCLAHQNSFCSTCGERCPVPGAIVVDAGRPRVDASTCVGCGVCQFFCPAPQNAIAILPVFNRPSPPEPRPQ